MKEPELDMKVPFNNRDKYARTVSDVIAQETKDQEVRDESNR